MAKNYESESKNSRNYTGTSDKNSYGNEMNHIPAQYFYLS